MQKEVENLITWIKDKCTGTMKEKQMKMGFLLFLHLRESSFSWDNRKKSRGIVPVYCTEKTAVAIVN